jgi:hypothetical protein
LASRWTAWSKCTGSSTSPSMHCSHAKSVSLATRPFRGTSSSTVPDGLPMSRQFQVRMQGTQGTFTAASMSETAVPKLVNFTSER